jgi:hypothetical protein
VTVGSHARASLDTVAMRGLNRTLVPDRHIAPYHTAKMPPEDRNNARHTQPLAPPRPP